MKNRYPPTALEVETCPPHHWIIDSQGVGKCRKCQTTQTFSRHEPKRHPTDQSRALSALGGRQSGQKRREKPKGVRAYANL